MKCKWCHRDLTRCAMDSRGLCVKDPQSSGVEKKRTHVEKAYDRRTR